MPKLSLAELWRGAVGAAAVIFAATGVAALAGEKPRAVAVSYALGYFTERLAGAALEVEFPVPDGSDPQFWRPGIEDISRIQTADLIVLNGAGFATWTAKASLPRGRIVETARGFSDRFISTETITHSHGQDGEHSHTGTASFTWLDQAQALRQAEAIADALAARGLVPEDDLSSRRKALAEDLRGLDAAAERLRPLAAGKVIIATHPRYQYLARAYGLDIRSLEWDAGAAPTPAQREELEALAAETGASILIWEAAPPAEARAAVSEIGLTGIVFPTMATPPDGKDYVAGMRTAIDDLTAALTAIGN